MTTQKRQALRVAVRRLALACGLRAAGQRKF